MATDQERAHTMDERETISYALTLLWDEGLIPREQMDRAEAWLDARLALIRKVAGSEPYCESGMGDIECVLCNGSEAHEGNYRETFKHEADCPLLLSRQLMEGE